jgi:hypothetical protein
MVADQQMLAETPEQKRSLGRAGSMRSAKQVRRAMNTINIEQTFENRYLNDRIKPLIRDAAGDGRELSALDILALDAVSAGYRIQAVLEFGLIDAHSKHIFACKCSERALSRIKNPSTFSLAAPAGKRLWLKSKITDAELSAVQSAAVVVWERLRDKFWWTAEYSAARSASWAASDDADLSAEFAAQWAACAGFGYAEEEWQAAVLVRLLRKAARIAARVARGSAEQKRGHR